MTAPDYYQSERNQVAEAVPADARIVIDVGCAAGRLGGALKRSRPGVRVYGIEPFPDAARDAEVLLDAVHVGRAEDAPPADWPTADCVVFADVLEHLLDPWKTLTDWSERLPPGGAAVISLPNVAHWTVLRGMLRSEFRYTDFGLLDRTHLRFFTRQTALELVADAGLHVERFERLVQPITGVMRWPLALAKWRSEPAVPLGSTGLASRCLDVYTYQFLIVARKQG